jgi:DNA-binding IclR family transcriptional regulator
LISLYEIHISFSGTSSEERKEERNVAVEVITRTFAVLEALAKAGEPLELGELTRRAGLPKPTVYRILRSLEELGYVAQEDGRGRYLTTPRLAHLGRGGERHALAQRLGPHLERLHRQFDETVNLGVLQGGDVHYLQVLETTRPLRLMVRPDAVDRFYCTALGRAMAAFLPEDERDRLVAAAKLEPITARTVRSKAALGRILDETRARGWAEDDEENDDGVACFATPVIEHDRPVAAISVSLPKLRLTPARRKELLCALTPIRL